LLGAGLEPLNAEEIELAASFNLGPGPCGRAWEYWSMRLDKVEWNWRAPATRAAANKPAAKRKAAVKTTTEKKRSKRRR
jgi:hypothetical protein